MQLGNLLNNDLVFLQVNIRSEKNLLQFAADAIHRAYPVIDNQQLFDKLLQRERLGSTGIGEGVAIPHCLMHNHIAHCTGEAINTLCAMITLTTAIPFNAIDNQPVDVFFILVALVEKQQYHLDALAAISRLALQKEVRVQWRQARNASTLLANF